ncbi:MAG: hypothetical protein H6Q49_878, partial [Deltaproteobacteria bacterium]|nr:hypothetical protein [Deltaproteobacteria bacterium]
LKFMVFMNREKIDQLYGTTGLKEILLIFDFRCLFVNRSANIVHSLSETEK